MSAISGSTATMAGMNMAGMAGMPGMGATTAGGATAAPAAPVAVPPAKGGCDMGAGSTKAGGAAQAAAGASAIGGGNDLASALAALTAAVKALADAVSKMAAKPAGSVAGVQGTAAATGQFVAPTAAPTRAMVTSGTEDSSFEQRVLELINAERAKAGLAAVVHNPLLDQAAEKHAVQMTRTNSMAHDGIGDGTPGERIRAEGFGSAWGENVAVGQTTPEQVVAEWMASPGHKRNIMDPNFRLSGIAQTQAADGRLYWAQEFGA